MSALRGLAAGLGEGLMATGRLFGEQALNEQRASLELEKQKALEIFKREQDAAPLNRFGIVARSRAQEEVPVTADPIVKTTRAGAEAIGLKDGLQGMTREQVLAYKDPEMLAQFDAQLAADNKIAQDAVAGKTRPRTSNEAFDAALEDVKINDPEAYVAGKKLVGEKTIKVGPNETILSSDGEVLFSNTKGEELRLKVEEAKDRRQQETEDRRDQRHRESLELQERKLEILAKKAVESGDKVLQHQFMNSLENDIRDAESRIKAMEKTKADLKTPKTEREAAAEAIVELTARKDMLRKSKIEFAREAGIRIPSAYQDGSASPDSADKPATKRLTFDPATGTFK